MKKILLLLIPVLILTTLIGFVVVQPDEYGGYSDIQDDHIGNAMLRLIDQGILEADGKRLYPDEPATIGEYRAIFEKLFDINVFIVGDDDSVVSGGEIVESLMAKLGIQMSLELYNLSQEAKVSRGELALLLVALVPNYISSADAVVQQTYTGTLVINGPNITLKNCSVDGDLVLAAGIGESSVTLDNVYVDGRLILIGTAFEQIIFANGSEITGKIIITQ